MCIRDSTLPSFLRRKSNSSDLPRMTPSKSLKPPTWAFEIFVIRPIVGLQIPDNKFISPTALAPISIIAISSFSVTPKTVKGTPIWLFRLPLVALTLYFELSTFSIKFLVVVFPFDPVNPIKGIFNFFLWYLARSCSSLNVSLT